MTFAWDHPSKGSYDGHWPAFPVDNGRSSYNRELNGSYNYNDYNSNINHNIHHNIHHNNNQNYNQKVQNYSYQPNEMLSGTRSHHNFGNASRIHKQHDFNSSYSNPDNSSCYKRRKVSDSGSGSDRKYIPRPTQYASTAGGYGGSSASERPKAIIAYKREKRDRSELEIVNDAGFMSKEEIESCSPSRKDGIDALHERHLRYSYCAFIQNLGMRLALPQTTIGTAMVLCHRFYIRRSHACHDKYLIATATLFLTAKSEETARPLNSLLTASSEIIYGQNLNMLTYMFPVGWFEEYKERVLEAEQLVLTTLNFELEVEHPFDPVTSVLKKLGLSQTMLVNQALSLVSEGLKSSLWLQFKPQHIAAGAVYLAAKMLSVDPNVCQNILREFQAPQRVLHEVVEQLEELL